MTAERPEATPDAAAVARTRPATSCDSLPIGTPVLAWPWTRDTSPFVTQTRSEVWATGDGTRVVAVNGRAGGIGLTHIDVLPALAAHTPPASDEWPSEAEREAERLRPGYVERALAARRAPEGEATAEQVATIEAVLNESENADIIDAGTGENLIAASMGLLDELRTALADPGRALAEHDARVLEDAADELSPGSAAAELLRTRAARLRGGS